MCIAIYKPAGKSISEETLRNCFDNNSDGCGFAYINTDNKGVRRIKIKKTLDFDVFLRQYRRAVRIAPSSPFIIHFRIKTHGPINVENCHPFRVDDSHVFIHNGMIKSMEYDKERSDTNRFNRDYLRLLPDGWMENAGIIRMITNIIDYGKIVLMNIDGDIQICNEKKGEWVGGVWFSNTSYKKRAWTSTSSTSGTYKGRSTTYSTFKGKSKSNNPGNNKRTDRFVNSLDKCVWSWTACDGCGSVRQIKSMDSYYDPEDNSALIYCASCRDRVLKEFKEMSNYEISDETYVDFINEGIGSENMLAYSTFKEWENPWGEIEEEDEEGDDGFQTVDEQMESYYQEQQKALPYNENTLH